MRAVVQRVTYARVSVGDETVGEIRPAGQGLVALVGVTHEDCERDAERLARKIWELRILDAPPATSNPASSGPASARPMSASECGAPILVVSQFTLYADTAKGRRPSWHRAAPGDAAAPLIEALVENLRGRGADVATGRFGAHMQISLVNDGPVTLILES